MACNISRKHVLMMPFAAFGHITPMLELAKKMAPFHNITFAVSQAKLKQIQDRQMLPPHFHDVITFYGLQDGVTEDVEQNISPTAVTAMAAAMIPSQRRLCQLMPAAMGPQANITPIQNMAPVDAVITDLLVDVPLEICHERAIPCHVFNTGPGWLYDGILRVTPATPTISDQEYLRGERGPDTGLPFAVEAACQDWLLDLCQKLPLAKSYISNSVAVLEENFLRNIVKSSVLRQTEIPEWYVGPLILEDTKCISKGEAQIVAWLEKQEPGSVVYVSFGSMTSVRPEQTYQIALGLLALNKPVIWSLRNSNHIHLPHELQSSIAGQFENALVLVVPWAPQKTILGHKSTGVFVSHCGWNGTMETISSGVPVVAWPMFWDQFTDADFLVSLGMAVKMLATGMESETIISAQEISSVIQTVGEWKPADKNNHSFHTSATKLAQVVRVALSVHGRSYQHLLKLVLSI